MPSQQQSATYFTFGGGLNTQASDLNASPQDAKDLLNVFITDAATIRRRPGYEFLPNFDSSTLFRTDTADFTLETSNFVDPAPSGFSFRVVTLLGDPFDVIITHQGSEIVIYRLSTIQTITTPENIFQRIPISSTFSTKAKYGKTRFVLDANRVYLVNPFLPLCFVSYNEDTGTFDFSTEDIYFRDLSDDAEPDDRVTVNSKTYRCIRAHIATSDNEPTTGEQWREYWVLEGKAPSTDAPDAWTIGSGSTVTIVDTESVGDPELTGTTIITYSYYLCIQAHTSASNNEPRVGANWETFWEFIRKESSTFTSFALGKWRGAENPLWVTATSYVDASTPTYNTSVQKVTWANALGHAAGFQAGTMSQGRLWLANIPGERNTLYFSQSIIEDVNYTRMYQFADPLNPDDPDVVDTDGGRIRLTAASEIVGVVDFLGGVLVLATNGLWYINGDDGFFRANRYNIKKISNDGCVGPFAWSAVENNIVYGATSGIYSISLDEISNQPVVTELSAKIKDFWRDIPATQREISEFSYNPGDFRMHIAINFRSENWFTSRNPYIQATRKRDMLIFHTKLGAWYKYSLSEDPDADKLTIGGLFNMVANLSGFEPVTVGGEDVTVDLVVVTNPLDRSSANTVTGLLLMKQNSNTMDWSIGHTGDNNLVDFEKSASDQETNDAFIQSVPQLFSDAGHRKQLPYLYTMFELVEDGFDITTGLFTNPGGCLYRVIWDWATSDVSPKWGQARQAYKPTKFNFVTEDGQLYPHSVVKNRFRVRGSGSALTFRFESDGVKDFHLLGWQANLTVSPRV